MVEHCAACRFYQRYDGWRGSCGIKLPPMAEVEGASTFVRADHRCDLGKKRKEAKSGQEAVL